jgi:hypothetical protein
MNKMTLKEAQEVLEDWPQDLALLIFDQSKTQEFDSKKYPEISELMTLRWYNFITHLLEAARVVEREKCIEALNSVGIVDQIGSSEHAFDAWVQAKTQCIEALKILSDNQDNNGN